MFDLILMISILVTTTLAFGVLGLSIVLVLCVDKEENNDTE